MIHLINHKDDGQFVINMASLHNAAQIRKILPRHLSAPRPLYTDRQAYHFEIAATLRVMQAKKREETQAKAKATREANKAKKKSRDIAMQVQQGFENIESDMEDVYSSEEERTEESTRGKGLKRRRAVGK